MFRKILIANRGEIALRIARTCRELGVRTVAVYSTADTNSTAVRYADEAVQIGPPAANASYLYAPNLIEAAKRCGAEAVHPGYGFLSEDSDFAEICTANDLTFIGPPPHVMRKIADKSSVRAQMADAGLPLNPGTDHTVGNLADAINAAATIGYPLVLKPAMGGGGRGITRVDEPAELPTKFADATATAQAFFGDSGIYLEKFVSAAAHIEAQILADDHGNVLYLGERDCTLQRRNQKLIEESPSPRLTDVGRAKLREYAVRAATELGYVGAGTLEFLADQQGRLTFMEINGRIQVEHPVTEMVSGIDIVAEQIRIAAGESLCYQQDQARCTGVAIECRVNAEDPDRAFLPTPGMLSVFQPPAGPFVRVDSGYAQGDVIPPHYDSLLAKILVWAADRPTAVARMRRALDEFKVDGPGVVTTTQLAKQLINHPIFLAGKHSTAFVDEFLANGDSGT